MPRGILITQCLQNDFVQPLEPYDPLPNSLHVGYDESRRLLGEIVEDGPIETIMGWAYKLPEDELIIIHIRDWHDTSDTGQEGHLEQFGAHCIRETKGSEFVFKNSIIDGRKHYIVDASGLNDFIDTSLDGILNRISGDNIKVGIIGVWTEAKISFLAYELKTRYPHFDLSVCSALTASSSRTMHFVSLDQMKNILGIKIFSSVGSFAEFLAGKMPDVVKETHPRLDKNMIKFKGGSGLSETDTKLMLYLFRECREVEARSLDGGFSGNVVLKTKSIDILGHTQVPGVIKIGDRDLIAKERIAFERIQEVLGNSAPSIVNFAEIDDRGAIKYRYASMLDGDVKTFQHLYNNTDMNLIYKILDTVFLEQLGRLYSASVVEKLDLLEYYDFSSKYSGSVRKRIEELLGEKADGEMLTLPGGIKIPNVCSFYEKDLDTLSEMASASHFMAYLHGDLNGRNILIDDQNNVWLIDFFHTHRGHILKDLIKLENDIQYIWTPIDSEDELEEAFRLSRLLAGVNDLGVPLPDNIEFKNHRFQKAYDTIRHLRSFYSELIRWDRDPYQLHAGLLRYSMHNLSFDESTHLQKLWALYAGSIAMSRVREYLVHSNELRIDYIKLDDINLDLKLGITMLPGRKDRGRNLEKDIESIRREEFNAVLSLVTMDELAFYGVSALFDLLKKTGIDMYHMSVLDQGVPTKENMNNALEWINKKIASGAKVLVHCVGGLGRSGTVAAAYLMKYHGLKPENAVNIVRASRSERAIESKEQMDFINNFQ